MAEDEGLEPEDLGRGWSGFFSCEDREGEEELEVFEAFEAPYTGEDEALLANSGDARGVARKRKPA